MLGHISGRNKIGYEMIGFGFIAMTTQLTEKTQFLLFFRKTETPIHGS